MNTNKETKNNNQIEPINFFKDDRVDFGYITANWLLDYLALNNADVLIFVDNNGKSICSSHLYNIGKSKNINELISLIPATLSCL